MVGFNINFLAEVAQVVEHGTENAGVDSSSLSLGTTYLTSKDSTPIPHPFVVADASLPTNCRHYWGIINNEERAIAGWEYNQSCLSKRPPGSPAVFLIG